MDKKVNDQFAQVLYKLNYLDMKQTNKGYYHGRKCHSGWNILVEVSLAMGKMAEQSSSLEELDKLIIKRF